MLHTNRAVTVEDMTKAPFEAYLLIEMDGEAKAMEILPNDVLDLQDLLEIYWGPDYLVTIGDQFAFNSNVTIKTDWSEPQSPICWEAGTFDIDMV